MKFIKYYKKENTEKKKLIIFIAIGAIEPFYIHICMQIYAK